MRDGKNTKHFLVIKRVEIFCVCVCVFNRHMIQLSIINIDSDVLIKIKS